MIYQYIYMHTVSNGAAVIAYFFSCGFGRVGQVRQVKFLLPRKGAGVPKTEPSKSRPLKLLPSQSSQK